MTRTRAAASSIASAMPSRRMQIAATTGAVSLVTTKFGRARTARSMNKRTASKVFNDAAAASSRCGRLSGGTRQTYSPATPSGSRLVVTIRTSGAAASAASTSAVTSGSTCSQLSSTNSSSRSRRWFVSRSFEGRPRVSRTPNAVRRVATTRSGFTTAARSTHHAPAAKRSATSAATCAASRVLPQPPGPVSVSRRSVLNRPWSATSSSSRPMNGFGGGARFRTGSGGPRGRKSLTNRG